MTVSFWENVANTPWWAYVVIFCLLILGWAATKPHEVPIKKLLIPPAFFIPISLVSLYLTLPFTVLSLGLWLVAAACGTLVGWLHFRILKVKAIKGQSSLHMPGTKSLYLLLLLIGVARYYYEFNLNDYLMLLTQVKYSKPIIASYGFLGGLLIGKVIYARRCIKTGPYWSAATTP
jgi:hypothetical protein